jgi:hypothetical protein
MKLTENQEKVVRHMFKELPIFIDFMVEKFNEDFAVIEPFKKFPEFSESIRNEVMISLFASYVGGANMAYANFKDYEVAVGAD